MSAEHPPSHRSERHLPGYEQTPRPQAAPDALTDIPPDTLETITLKLMELQYGPDGLTRDEIRKRVRDFPEAIYLRMPSSRRYLNADEAMRDAAVARSRAEGDFLGPNPDIPEAQSVEDGGPPAWGGDPLLTLDGVEDGGSAEDTDGLASSGNDMSPREGHSADLDR